MTFLDGEGWKQLNRIMRAARSAADVVFARAEPARAGLGERWPLHRAYAPGDDYRWIDWNVCARHDELLYRPPPFFRDRPVYLLIDCSRSMTSGTPSKWERAIRIAAGLGAAALASLALVGALGFADGLVAEFPPMRGTARCLTLARFLDQLKPEGKHAELRAAVPRLAQWGPPGLTLVVGDFLAPESYCRGLEALKRSGHAVGAVHVCDREDAQPNLLGPVVLCDIETGDRLAAVLGQRDLSAFRAAFDAFCETLRRFCRGRRIKYHRNWEHTPWQRTVFEAMGLVVR